MAPPTMPVNALPTPELNARSEGQRRRYASRPERPERSGIDALTLRERELLVALAELGSQKMVAERLDMSLQTVKNHLTTIRQKLDTQSALQACVIYDRWLRGIAPAWPDIDRRSGSDRRRSGVDRRQA